MIIYKIKSGDTLWYIAERLLANPYRCWEIWWDNFRYLRGKSADEIYPDEILIINE